jgi:hypothetical protein
VFDTIEPFARLPSPLVNFINRIPIDEQAGEATYEIEVTCAAERASEVYAARCPFQSASRGTYRCHMPYQRRDGPV